MDVAKDLILGEEGTAVTLQVLRGITQLESGPIVRHSRVTIQQVCQIGPSCAMSCKRCLASLYTPASRVHVQ